MAIIGALNDTKVIRRRSGTQVVLVRFWLSMLSCLLVLFAYGVAGEEDLTIEDQIAMLPDEFAQDLRDARKHVLAISESDVAAVEKSNAWGDLGMIYHGQQMLSAAEDAYRSANEIFQNPRWHYYLSIILLERGQQDEALGHLQQVVLFMPEYTPAWFRIGKIYLAQGAYDSAKGSFDSALQLTPQAAPIHAALGDVLFEQEMYEQALQKLNEAWNLAPGVHSVAYRIARIYQIHGDSNAHEDWVRRSEESASSSQIEDPLLVEVASMSYNSRFFYKAAGWAIARGDFQTAIEAMHHATDLDPTNEEYGLRYAYMLSMAQHVDAAIDEAKRVIAHHIDSANAWYTMAWLLRASSDSEAFVEGLAAARKAVELSDDDQHRRLAAAMFMRAGKFDEAKVDYEKLVSDNPANPYYHYWLGVAKLGSKDCHGVMDINTARRLQPSYGEAQVALARALAFCGQLALAETRINALLETSTSPEIEIAGAYINLFAGNTDSAVDVATTHLPNPDAELIVAAAKENSVPNVLFMVGSPYWLPDELQ